MILGIFIFAIVLMFMGVGFGLIAWENRDPRTGVCNDDTGVVANALLFSFGAGLFVWSILLYIGYISMSSITQL